MKRMIRSSKSIEASEFNKSDMQQAVSFAEALKYILDDMSSEDFSKVESRSPKFYDALNDFISHK